jgi:peptidylprolyl isomerase
VSKQKTNLSVSKRREEMRRQQEVRRQRTLIGLGLAMALIIVAYVLWLVFVKAEEPVVLEGERPLAQLDPADRENYYSAYPPMVIDTAKSYEAIITVAGKGDMRLSLFDDEAPLAVNNFVFLANEGYYDGLKFHRVIEDFMAQGGDPTGVGNGGPGYTFEDETDNGLTFNKRGLLAMANAGPNTNGSQFFITFVETPWLDGNHTIFGELVEGDDVLSSLTPDPTGQAGDIIERIVIVER